MSRRRSTRRAATGRSPLADVTDQARTQIIRRHARMDWRDQPMKCQAAKGETRDGNHGKVIYDTRAAAEACERELRRLGDGRMWAYPCHRSQHGHHHLTHKTSGSELTQR